MNTRTKTLVSALLLLFFSVNAYAKDNADDDAAVGDDSDKIYICHNTSSTKNPWVLIHVSTSAKQAHLDHGDPGTFTDLGKKECAPSIPAPAPTVTLTLGASMINIGATTTATWTSTNATSCTLNGAATSGVNASGTVGPYSSADTQTITVVCIGIGGTATDSETLTVNALKLPTVTLTLAQNSILVNTATTASWTSTNATSCTLNGAPTSDVNGTSNVGPYGSAGPQQITVVCTGEDGSATDTKTLTVTPALPTVILTLASYSIDVNTTTTASWTSTNSTSCTLNGAPAGSTSGSLTIGPYLVGGTVNVTVVCTGSGGSATDTETLTVVQPNTPPSTSVLFCATSRIGTTSSKVWVVRYDYQTLTFEGNSVNAPVITGTVVPDPSKPVEQALFAANSSFTYQVGQPAPGILATGGQSTANVGIDGVPPGQVTSYFRVTVFTLDILGIKVTILGNHLMQFDTTCPELENVPPPPER